MTITNAGIKSKYPTAAQFLFIDIWYEAQIDPTTEDPKQATLDLIKLADQTHREAFPHMYLDQASPAAGQTTTPIIETIETIEPDKVVEDAEQMIADMDACTDFNYFENEFKYRKNYNSATKNAFARNAARLLS